MLQNEKVCGNTIYSSSEASGVNNDFFSTRTKPELKTWYYHALLSYVTILATKQKWFAHNPLISSLEVSLPLSGMLACQYSNNCFVMWRSRDTISAQTMARHQSRV